jgi:large subunit ribosomal protein L16
MLFPARVKYRKSQRGKRRGLAVRCSNVAFGEYGIKAVECAWLKSNQLESARIILSRALNRGGKMWIRVFPDKSIQNIPLKQEWEKEKARLTPG